jgi:hypothetical protein
MYKSVEPSTLSHAVPYSCDLQTSCSSIQRLYIKLIYVSCPMNLSPITNPIHVLHAQNDNDRREVKQNGRLSEIG